MSKSQIINIFWRWGRFCWTTRYLHTRKVTKSHSIFLFPSKTRASFNGGILPSPFVFVSWKKMVSRSIDLSTTAAHDTDIWQRQEDVYYGNILSTSDQSFTLKNIPISCMSTSTEYPPKLSSMFQTSRWFMHVLRRPTGFVSNLD